MEFSFGHFSHWYSLHQSPATSLSLNILSFYSILSYYFKVILNNSIATMINYSTSSNHNINNNNTSAHSFSQADKKISHWLDTLEKEFDKAYVDLDMVLGEIDADQAELIYEGRQKMTALSSAFAQLVHKSQTIFSCNARLQVGSIFCFL